MKYLQIILSFSALVVLVSCQGMQDSTPAIASAKPSLENKAEKQPVVEPVIEESIQYDKSDPEWEKKKRVDELLVKLAAATWQEREKAQKELIDLIIASGNNLLDYLIIRSLDQEDPEISFRAKKVIQDFFYKTVYDPKRKKGFIGLQLAEQGGMVINKQKYRPIRIVMPQNGFPGKAAGIKQGDLILGVDGKICGNNFTMKDFILYIGSLRPGTEIKLVIFSFGVTEVKKIKLAERPGNIQPAEPKQSKKELFDTWFKIRKKSVLERKSAFRLE